jgi:hypothetical protein
VKPRQELPAHGMPNSGPSPDIDTGTKVRTQIAVFTTSDRATWHTDSSDWTAELRRSRHGRHSFLALFAGGVYCGRYDLTGWHAATDRKRIRQMRSYQLPLVA